MTINYLIIACSILAHPVHIAYSNIEINSETDSISVSHKALLNDFTLLFYHLFEKNIEPKEGKDFTASEIGLINSYMTERFILSSGSDTVSLHYVHKEQDGEFIWLFYSGKLPGGKTNQLVINNMMLFDINMDQTNLVIVTYGDQQSGFTFNWENRQSLFDLP